MSDLYAVLNIPKDASASEIKRSYRKLAKAFHPDISRSAGASRRMQEVNAAYAILGDPVRRAEYDQMQQMQGAQGEQQAQTVASEPPQAPTVSCSRCGKVDATLRVSTFTTVWSIIILSFYKGWAYILCARCRVITSLKFNTQVLLFGWWGFPWGPIWSLSSLVKNAAGGHQPRENNATLLAIVGQNLINLGDFDEAEKALTASLELRDDPAVVRLLQIAKSRAGYKRRPSFGTRLVGLESHPIFYNAVLVLAIVGLFLVLVAVTDIPKVSAPVPVPVASTTANAGDQGQYPEITWWQKLQAKINLARGDRWALPIQLGDTKGHVYEVLGDPASDSDPAVAGYKHLGKDFGSDEENEYWPDKGLNVAFRNGLVSSIYASGGRVEAIAKTRYNGDLYYGVHAGDDLATMYSHLGKPFKADPMWGCTWRFGTSEISANLLTTAQTSGNVTVGVGEAWGGITIEDIRPELEAEADAKAEKDRVTLTGAPLTAQEIYEKYKNRIFIVTALNSLGQPIALGTGFQFRGNLIATNYHVVQDAHKITIKKLDDSAQPLEAVVVWIADNSKQSQEAELKGTPFLGDRQNDWAILGSPGAVMPDVQAGGSPATGEAVTVIGNPEGFSGSVTTGVVSGIRDDNWIQMSAPISHGSSGSPVFDSTGRWIGIATLTDTAGQNLNFATPSQNIVDKVKQEMDATEGPNKAMRMQASLPLRQIDFDPIMLGMLHRQNKDLPDVQASIADINTLLKSYQDPSDQAELLSDLEDFYETNLGDFKSALDVTNRWILLNKDNYKGWEKQGMLLAFRFNDETDARNCLQRAIQVAQAQIQVDLDKNTKQFNDSEYAGESVNIRKLDQQTLDSSNGYTHMMYASDAIEIGRMYLTLRDVKNGVQWLQNAKAWANNPYVSSRADSLLQEAANVSQPPAQPAP